MSFPKSRCRSFVLATLLMTTATMVVPARAEPQAGGAAPVLVDFRVVTDDGQPVVDLTPADVTLRVGGRQRPIKSLEVVRIGSGGASAPVASKLSPPFSSNAAAAGSSKPGSLREVMIVIDELSISPGKEPAIREALSKLLAALTPSDRVAILSTRQGGSSHGFTENHEGVRAVISKFAGHAAARVTDSDFACNAQLSLNTLKAAFSQFSTASAPTLVYVSAALSGPSTSSTSVGSASELCVIRTNHFEEVGVAAQASHANVYVVHALDAASPSQSPQSVQIGIDAIAGATGAETIRVSGGTGVSLGRIATETSAYYLAAFDAEPADRTGNRQRVEVRVARERVRVNARPHIVIGKGEGGVSAKALTPSDMIRVSTVFTDLPLRAATYASRNADGKIRIIVLFEPVDPANKLNAVSVIAYDAKGSGKAQWKGQGSELAATPVRAALIADPGTYRVRVAATDSAGRAGTVDVETRAELVEAGALKMSALVLGISASGTFAPRLQFDAGDQQAIGYVEVYGVPKGANLGVTFELAEVDGGPAIATGPSQISAPTEDSRLAFGGFGIGPMEPGDLQMRAVITMDGKPVGSVTRTLRKTK
jgi:VWFA-related protein